MTLLTDFLVIFALITKQNNAKLTELNFTSYTNINSMFITYDLLNRFNYIKLVSWCYRCKHLPNFFLFNLEIFLNQFIKHKK